MIWLTVTFLLLGSSLCSAQLDLRPYNATAKVLFDANDIDKDLRISRQEIQLSFQHYDSDFDGVISRQEYATYLTHTYPAMFGLSHSLYDIFDRDKNGILTEYDYIELFKLWDVNENGVVSEPEFIHWWTVTLTSLDRFHHPDDTFPPSELDT